MEYQVNPAKLGAVFMLPCEVVDKHIKLVSAVQLKVLLWSMRNLSTGITAEKISEALGLPVVDIADALLYWTESGVLLQNGAQAPSEQSEKKVETKKAVTVSKPGRDEVVKRGNESEEIAFLLREAQMKFGRNLRQSEASTLVWLADDEGMNIAVILMLIEYAKAQGKCTVGFIERTAIEWINDGVNTLSGAEDKICRMEARDSAWGKVCSAMGLERRRPSKKELDMAVKWVDEWNFSNEMLRIAYDKCVDATSKFSMSYVSKILEGWHKNGVDTPEKAEAEQPEKMKKNGKKESYAGYDLSEIEQMLFDE